MVVARGRKWELVFNRYGVSVWEDESKFWRWMNNFTKMQMYLVPLNDTLKNGYSGKFHVMPVLPQSKIIFQKWDMAEENRIQTDMGEKKDFK